MLAARFFTIRLNSARVLRLHMTMCATTWTEKEKSRGDKSGECGANAQPRLTIRKLLSKDMTHQFAADASLSIRCTARVYLQLFAYERTSLPGAQSASIHGPSPLRSPAKMASTRPDINFVDASYVAADSNSDAAEANASITVFERPKADFENRIKGEIPSIIKGNDPETPSNMNKISSSNNVAADPIIRPKLDCPEQNSLHGCENLKRRSSHDIENDLSWSEFCVPDINSLGLNNVKPEKISLEEELLEIEHKNFVSPTADLCAREDFVHEKQANSNFPREDFGDSEQEYSGEASLQKSAQPRLTIRKLLSKDMTHQFAADASLSIRCTARVYLQLFAYERTSLLGAQSASIHGPSSPLRSPAKMASTRPGEIPSIIKGNDPETPSNMNEISSSNNVAADPIIRPKLECPEQNLLHGCENLKRRSSHDIENDRSWSEFCVPDINSLGLNNVKLENISLEEELVEIEYKNFVSPNADLLCAREDFVHEKQANCNFPREDFGDSEQEYSGEASLQKPGTEELCKVGSHLRKYFFGRNESLRNQDWSLTSAERDGQIRTWPEQEEGKTTSLERQKEFNSPTGIELKKNDFLTISSSYTLSDDRIEKSALGNEKRVGDAWVSEDTVSGFVVKYIGGRALMLREGADDTSIVQEKQNASVEQDGSGRTSIEVEGKDDTCVKREDGTNTVEQGDGGMTLTETKSKGLNLIDPVIRFYTSRALVHGSLSCIEPDRKDALHDHDRESTSVEREYGGIAIADQGENFSIEENGGYDSSKLLDISSDSSFGNDLPHDSCSNSSMEATMVSGDASYDVFARVSSSMSEARSIHSEKLYCFRRQVSKKRKALSSDSTSGAVSVKTNSLLISGSTAAKFPTEIRRHFTNPRLDL
ncbi:hypothetical protein FHG87_012146 [Trinorchestia longiramus]|nr:hypothetical protein FHG87_012146 [Trinorchestia longiramus]